jgi:hypothetical protein
MKRASGATLPGIMEATGWQKHMRCATGPRPPFPSEGTEVENVPRPDSLSRGVWLLTLHLHVKETDHPGFTASRRPPRLWRSLRSTQDGGLHCESTCLLRGAARVRWSRRSDRRGSEAEVGRGRLVHLGDALSNSSRGSNWEVSVVKPVNNKSGLPTDQGGSLSRTAISV